MKRLEAFCAYALSLEVFLCSSILVLCVAMASPARKAFALFATYTLAVFMAGYLKARVKQHDGWGVIHAIGLPVAAMADWSNLMTTLTLHAPTCTFAWSALCILPSLRMKLRFRAKPAP